MQPASPARKQRRTLSLKTKLAGAILITVSATAAIVHFPWLLASNKNTESIVEQLNEAITRQTSREVGNIFDNVNSAQVLIQKTFLDGFVDLNNEDEREAFYLNVLAANPNFTWVQFGYPNGDYLGLQRGQDGIINIINRQYNPQTGRSVKTVESYQIMDQDLQLEEQDLQLVDTETIPDEDYYALQRPWYKAAMANRGEQAWTNVYMFATGKVPGIDSAITLDEQGQLLGVISIAFDLKRISLFLRQLRGDRDGEIFIVNSKGELIAFTDVTELGYTLRGQDKADLITIAASQNPSLRFAYQTLQTNQIDLSQLTSRVTKGYRDPETGNHYYISIAPLDHLDWSVGTVIPKSNYLEEINRNKKILFFIVSGFIITAAGTAVFLTDRFIAQPVLTVAKAAADIEAEKFDLDSLDQVTKQDDELGQLARVFQKMAREVYAREQRLKQTVHELRIEIDEVKRKKQVNEIVESDFFQDLQAKARLARNRLGGPNRRDIAKPEAEIDVSSESPNDP